MSQDLHQILELEPEFVTTLASRARTRWLSFLLRWEHVDELHACLNALSRTHPLLVSLMDLRARAFLVQGRPNDALVVMRERLQLRASMTARALLGRIHLARQDTDAALTIARDLVRENKDSVTVWNLLGQVELERQEIDSAMDAYHHLNVLSPQSRAYLLGMVDLYRAQGDWVTASGYAVRLLRTSTEQTPLPIACIRQLREYFVASEENTWVVSLDAELQSRYTKELEEIRTVLALASAANTSSTTRPFTSREPPRSAESLPALEQIPVSEAEQTHILEAARRFFGFDVLLPGQLQALACVLRGEDVLTILPTGGGKSLCYQLPAMLDKSGTTLVIAPLIALMKDQIDSLPTQLRNKATTINSSLNGDELRRRLARLAAGSYRLVYAAPERLRQPVFLHAVRQAKLNRLVIDEAHCVSVWGHDFRPDYLTITQAHRALSSPPLLALTATAPPRVRRDILGHLGEMRLVAGDVTRPNLTLEVFRASNADAKLRRLLAFCTSTPGSGIVYVDTRARSERLAALLRGHGVAAQHYHAGIPHRHSVQDEFMAGHIRVVVATIAFGMGIDKPDIRFIVHFGPARSLEAYYQEAGRAGRDGLAARCLLLYTSSDRATMTRRARGNLIQIEFLRATYGAVKRRLDGHSYGRVVRADLERDLRATDTDVRVALGLLAEAELLRCGPDLPRTAAVRLRAAATSASNAHFVSFCQAARILPGQAIDLDLLDAARKTDIPVNEIEDQLLVWADAGWINYRSSGHDLFVELPPPPHNASERVATLIERYETIAVQRVQEMVAYATTSRCRHGHINAYLGGRTIEQCDACDSCVDLPPLPPLDLSDEREQMLTILECISNAEWGGWGRRTLVGILRGTTGWRGSGRQLRAEARGQAEFGALAFRSATSIGRLIDVLLHEGLLQERKLENGGTVIELGAAGQAALGDHEKLASLLTPTLSCGASDCSDQTSHAAQQKGLEDLTDLGVDETLFHKLRAWRRARAQADKVPPYVILHDKTLQTIAAQHPTTPENLRDVKGIGEVKLAKYGTQVIEIVCAHLSEADLESD